MLYSILRMRNYHPNPNYPHHHPLIVPKSPERAQPRNDFESEKGKFFWTFELLPLEQCQVSFLIDKTDLQCEAKHLRLVSENQE